jgi:Fur family transcriptional regulator, ferric uptake regulator
MIPPASSPICPQPVAPSAPVERELLVARVKSAGLKVTTARIALLDVLARSKQPLTIDQLFLLAGSETCDLVTIYRSMAAFERAGVVYRSGFSERGAALYCPDAGGTRRYPLLRKGTEVIEDLDSESAAEIQTAIEKIKQRLHARGYEGLQHIVEFFALSAR